jgi:exopolysaccharide biosynthesis polyprenyl glycosylphosphotransferase
MKKAAFAIRYLIVDFASALIAWVIYYALRRYVLEVMQDDLSFWLFGSGITIASFWVMIYAFWGAYIDVFRKSRLKEFFSLLSACLLGAVIIFFMMLLSDNNPDSYVHYFKTVGLYFLLHFTITALNKLYLIAHTKRLIINRKICFNTLLIGSASRAADILGEMSTNHPSLGYHFSGYVYIENDEDNHTVRSQLPALGSYKNLDNIIRDNKIEEVIIALESSEHKRIEEILNFLQEYALRVSIIPDMYSILLGSVKVNHIFGTPLIEIKRNLMPVWQTVTKRFIDIVCSIVVLILGAPFYLAIALITKFTSSGSVFFKQERVGKDGKPFMIYKFRSMYVDAEAKGPALSSDHDPRITPWGRFMRRTRLDETPQFYNVLKGEMSLVGPRPERQYFIDLITQKAPHYRHLQRVRPGITSLGQVKYGYAENVDQMVRRLKFDIIYIENMSLAMDFRILFYTILIILQGRGK